MKARSVFMSLLLAPVVGAAFLLAQGGKQPAKLSDADFGKIAATHGTAQEHQRLADHYTAHAVEHESDAKTHEDLAAKYDKDEPALAGEARHYAAHSKEAAEALRNLARIHRDLAAKHSRK
jgi:hypothetical protein